MHAKESATLCVAPDAPTRRSLGGAEATIIVVIIVVAAALTAGGMPDKEALALLSAAGLLSATVTRLAAGAVTGVLWHLAQVQPAPLPHRA